jgi:hypothetical protein
VIQPHRPQAQNIIECPGCGAKNQLNPGDDPNALLCGKCKGNLEVNVPGKYDPQQIECTCSHCNTKHYFNSDILDSVGNKKAFYYCTSCNLKNYLNKKSTYIGQNLIKDPHYAPPSPVLDFTPSGPQTKPWVRFWARTIDGILFVLLAGIALALIYPAALKMNDALLSIIILFAYVFVEPCMLSSWGTTPGKALLNIRLRKSNGTKPNFSEALSRAFNVWIRGLGLGIPIVALFTQINAYKRLTKDGMTSWDKDGGFKINHKLIGAGRVIAAIAIFVGFCFLIALGGN